LKKFLFASFPFKLRSESQKIQLIQE